ncbi:MAG: hypothetical protein OEW85_05290 [Acidimicrobiia bacterium]|nr:hypothetical protein [Acidimicrobiia bacterium]
MTEAVMRRLHPRMAAAAALSAFACVAFAACGSGVDNETLAQTGVSGDDSSVASTLGNAGEPSTSSEPDVPTTEPAQGLREPSVSADSRFDVSEPPLGTFDFLRDTEYTTIEGAEMYVRTYGDASRGDQITISTRSGVAATDQIRVLSSEPTPTNFKLGELPVFQYDKDDPLGWNSVYVVLDDSTVLWVNGQNVSTAELVGIAATVQPSDGGR